MDIDTSQGMTMIGPAAVSIGEFLQVLSGQVAMLNGDSTIHTGLVDDPEATDNVSPAMLMPDGSMILFRPIVADSIDYTQLDTMGTDSPMVVFRDPFDVMRATETSTVKDITNDPQDHAIRSEYPE